MELQARNAAPRRRKAAGPLSVALFAAVLAITACGKGGSSDVSAAQGRGVSGSDVAVIEGWTDALRDGHPQRAAGYWAHPSVMVNGPDESGRVTLIHIHSQRDALLADETLSCGATLRSTTRSGSYVRASFVLGPRSGAGASKSGCSGPASVDFLISKGHIVRWLRAPAGERPGQSPTSPTPPPAGEPGGASGAQSI